MDPPHSDWHGSTHLGIHQQVLQPGVVQPTPSLGPDVNWLLLQPNPASPVPVLILTCASECFELSQLGLP